MRFSGARIIRVCVVALRRRLRCPRAAGVSDPVHPPHCNHRHAHLGTFCGVALDSRDLHVSTCNVGGGVDHGHNRIRDWLKGWLEERLGQVVATEEHVSGWDRPSGELDAEGNPTRMLPHAGAVDVMMQDKEAEACVSCGDDGWILCFF